MSPNVSPSLVALLSSCFLFLCSFCSMQPHIQVHMSTNYDQATPLHSSLSSPRTNAYSSS